MIRRKQAKTITQEEFLSKKNNVFSCDIEDILCADYVYILDSMDMEDFEYDDTSFDIFKELVFKNKVVGFVSYMDSKNSLTLMESYVMPEYRNNNLLYDEISSKDNLVINVAKISLVKALIKCSLAIELSDSIVVSKIPFSVSTFDLNNREDAYDFTEYLSYVYDLNNGSVLLLENPESFNYSKPRRSDEKKYDLKGDISDDYLNKAREIVEDYDEKYLKVSNLKSHPTIVFLA